MAGRTSVARLKVKGRAWIFTDVQWETQTGEQGEASS